MQRMVVFQRLTCTRPEQNQAQPQLQRRMTTRIWMGCLALIGCAWLAPGEAFGQSALDLPGMDAVMMHHDLSTTTLDRTWTEHVQAAVLVSQGWVEVATPKAGIPVEDLQVLRGPNVPQALLPCTSNRVKRPWHTPQIATPLWWCPAKASWRSGPPATSSTPKPD